MQAHRVRTAVEDREIPEGGEKVKRVRSESFSSSEFDISIKEQGMSQWSSAKTHKEKHKSQHSNSSTSDTHTKLDPRVPSICLVTVRYEERSAPMSIRSSLEARSSRHIFTSLSFSYSPANLYEPQAA